MPASQAFENLKSYLDRLKRGKADKIKPSHVKKVLEKLEKREKELRKQRKETKKESKKKRLKHKIAVNRKQAERARWLLKKLSSVGD